uniref:Uncharacterized protein n=1 Tax=viral metagenome TaxID=1070528 RepID=A0A6M3LZ69_9ZZZZ
MTAWDKLWKKTSEDADWMVNKDWLLEVKAEGNSLKQKLEASNDLLVECQAVLTELKDREMWLSTAPLLEKVEAFLR